MSAAGLAGLLLALAVLVAPGRAVVSARLSAVSARLTTLANQPTDRPADGPANQPAGWAAWQARRLPALAALGTACLTITCLGPLAGGPLGMFLGAAIFLGWQRFAHWLPVRRRARRPDAAEAFRLAGSWDLLAACLRGGLPVPAAVRAIAPEVPGDAGPALCRSADLLALGADPIEAWAPALAHPSTERLARSARRSARSGAALAGVAETLAAEARANAHDFAEARAQRAAVAVTGPLGLCFLPAFGCLGVLPVVIGLATRLMASW